MRRPLLSLITVIAVALALVPSARAQGTVGTVTGTIRERGSERPLAGVQVRVVGTQRGAISDATGNHQRDGGSRHFVSPYFECVAPGRSFA